MNYCITSFLSVSRSVKVHLHRSVPLQQRAQRTCRCGIHLCSNHWWTASSQNSDS